MNNADFAKLLVSDDKALVKELTQPKSKTKKKREDPRKGKGKGKDGEKGKGKGEDVASTPKGPDYRDRAKERREGTGEYENIAAEWETHETIETEQSKYLGGDLEHTHLVKGLDFSLLSKVRTEMSKRNKAEELKSLRSESKKEKKQQSFQNVLSRKVWRACVETLHPHQRMFQTRLQNMNKALSMGQRIRGAPSVFLPGRMEYEFDITMDAESNDIPKIVYISKEDAPKVDLSLRVASVQQETIARVRASMQKAADDKKKRKLDKSGADATYAVAEKKVVKTVKAVDADNDIFGGVGGFDASALVNEVEKKAAAKAAAAAARRAPDSAKKAVEGKEKPKEKPKASYFDDAGDAKYLQAPEGQLDLKDIGLEGGDEEADDDGVVREFEAAEKWKGAKKGWVFKLGPQGLGYYTDIPLLGGKFAKTRSKTTVDPNDKRDPTNKRNAVDPLASTTASKKKGRTVRDAADDGDAYGELFPTSMLNLAGVGTGDGADSDEEPADGKKTKREQEKDDKKKKVEAGTSDSYGKKGDGDAKKKKMSELQELQKIEQMMKKGSHRSVSEVEGSMSAAQKQAKAPREARPTS